METNGLNGWGADVNARDNNMNVALMSAVRNNPEPDIIERYVKLGADVNAALIEAIRVNPSPNVIECLAKLGADVNAALIAAIRPRLNPDVVECLVKLGADVNVKNNNGDTALISEVQGQTPRLDVVDRLIELGADVNARDNSGMTALMWAEARNGDPSVVTRLVELGADVDARDKNGWTAWMFARLHKARIPVPLSMVFHLQQSMEEYADDSAKVEDIIKGWHEGADYESADRYSGSNGRRNLMEDIGFDNPGDYSAWLDSR